MYLKYAAALAVVLPLTAAQTWSDCNPRFKSCKPKPGLASSTFSTDFTQGSMDGWDNFGGAINFGPDGAEFTVAKKGDSPTIETDFYFFFGKAEVVFKCAPGQGIVSSIVLESDVLDEVDWETIGGDTTQIQTNYFGKGDTSSYDRGGFSPVNDPQGTFHTYTINWSPTQIDWLIDGAIVRTLTSDEAQGGTRFPQTPMRLKLGIWAGGDPDNAPGTIEWAGGETNYAAGPYTMYVKSAYIENTHPSNTYTYGDNTGRWQSIEYDGKDGSAPPPEETTTKTTTTKTSTSTSTSTEEEPTSTSTHTTTTKTETESSTTTTTIKTPSSTPTQSGSSSAGQTSTGTNTETTGPSETAGPSSTPTPTQTEFPGAASALTTSSLSLVALLGLLTAMLQL